MKGGGGKRKGSGFERTVCKALSRWVTGNARGDVFWRSAMSGGRATVHGLNVRQAGDITAVSPEGFALVDTYLIECKFYRDLDIAGFILKRTGKLSKFWARACKDAKPRKLSPMIIAKQNHYPVFVVTGTQAAPEIILFTKLLRRPPPR